MMEIVLTRGKVALIDDADYEYINQFKWHAGLDTKGRFTARRTKRGSGGSKLILMHRFILGVTDSCIWVDHIDRNPLNNQRSNLRICSPSQNSFNRDCSGLGSSRFKGVSWHKKMSKWQARIQIPGTKKSKHIGQFKSELEAAIAYNKWAEKLHQEFAVLNQA